jgi:uncharacterized protein (DUF4415 family)
MLEYPWDPAKSAANLRLRGFDFEFAARIFEEFTVQQDGAIIMSAKHTAKRSKIDKSPLRGRADLARLRAMGEAEIARNSPPELASLPDDFWDNGTLVMPMTKEAISLRVDADILEWFRSLGPRYQTRMNAVLRAYMSHARGRTPRTRAVAELGRRTGKGNSR